MVVGYHHFWETFIFQVKALSFSSRCILKVPLSLAANGKLRRAAKVTVGWARGGLVLGDISKPGLRSHPQNTFKYYEIVDYTS